MGRRDECPVCGKDSRICLNCSHYDQSFYRECREPGTEWVREKDQGNFCGYFAANVNAPPARSSREEAALHQRKLAELFKNGAPPEPPRFRSPEDLFKKP